MPLPPNIYGDVRIPIKTVGGRPTHIHAIGDSIINAWFGTFATQYPGIIGYDDTTGNPIGNTGKGNATTPPAALGAFVTGTWAYLYRQTTGQAVVRGAHGIGATTININNLAGGLLPAGNGYPGQGFTVTLDVAGQQETGRVANTYTGQGGLPSAGANSNTIPLAAATTKTHADGTIISWTRPSTIRGYTMKTVSETLFATAASPVDGAWTANRLCDFTTVGDSANFGEGIETNYFHDGPILNQFGMTCVMLYLALPQNTGAPNLRMYGRTAELAPTQVTTDFSIYNATPLIKAVSVVLPAPGTYNSTVGARFTVNSPNAGNFTAGQVFVCLGFFVVKTGATSGTVVSAMSDGGMQIQDLANDAASFGVIYDPTYMAQHWSALNGTVIGGPDILEINLGQNNAPTTTNAIVTFLKNIRDNWKVATPRGYIIYATPYNTTGLHASGADAVLSAVCPLIGKETDICAFDFVTECGNYTMVANRYTADGTHPTSPGGKEWFAAQYIKFRRACEAAVYWDGVGQLSWPAWAPKSRAQ